MNAAAANALRQSFPRGQAATAGTALRWMSGKTNRAAAKRFKVLRKGNGKVGLVRSQAGKKHKNFHKEGSALSRLQGFTTFGEKKDEKRMLRMLGKA